MATCKKHSDSRSEAQGSLRVQPGAIGPCPSPPRVVPPDDHTTCWPVAGVWHVKFRVRAVAAFAFPKLSSEVDLLDSNCF
eukprot:749421-Hanusia_phi.AAC.3